MPFPILTRSYSFREYLSNRKEVIELIRIVPTDEKQLKSRQQYQLANALYRASVVLMSSHLERYVESLVVESIDAINACRLLAGIIPQNLRLAQLKAPLQRAHQANNLKTIATELHLLFTDYVGLWNEIQPCDKLTADHLISGFDNPLPKRISNLFAPFGHNDILGPAIGLDKSLDRSLIEVKIRELVEKRNAIAHTGMTTDLTREDVLTYLRCLRRLIRGIDIIVGKQIETITGNWPWQV